MLGDSFQSLADLLQDRARQFPHKTAFTFLKDGEVELGHLTYQLLEKQARSIAGYLQSADDQNNSNERSKCAILLYSARSALQFIPAFFGCLYTGKIAVPSYPPRKERQWLEFERRIETCDVDFVLTTSDLQGKLQKHWNRRGLSGRSKRSLNWLATDDLSAQGAATWQPPNLSYDSIAYLQHTSGSTGVPKGVVVTHGNVLHNSEMIRQSFEHDASLRVLSWLPFNHDMGLVGGVIQPLYVGGSSVFMTSTAFVQKPVRWLRAISNYRITTSGGPNFAYDLLCQRVSTAQKRNLNLSNWKVAFCGAEPVRAKTLAAFAAQFLDCGFQRRAFYPCYGMAETTLLISGGSRSALPVVRQVDERSLRDNRVKSAPALERSARSLVGCGHTWLGSRICIVNPDTQSLCPENEVGEIWVQGKGVGQGYWNQPEVTSETFQARLLNTDKDTDVDEGTFLRTGDLGFLENDELFITGRLKEVIKFWGSGVYPQHLEETLEGLSPAFLSHGSAAFSVEIEGAERVAIAQELDRHTCRNLTPKQIKTLVNQIRRALLFRHFIDVYAIVFLKPGGLPKTTSGKIQRRLCQRQFLAGDLPFVEQWICPEKKRFNYARWSGLFLRIDKFNLINKIRDA